MPFLCSRLFDHGSGRVPRALRRPIACVDVAAEHSIGYFSVAPHTIATRTPSARASCAPYSSHSYNPYRVGCTLGKTLAMPALTYACDTLAYLAHTVKCMDCHQNELGRWLLGGSFSTANAAVMRELSWSAFEVREARSKIQYAGRLRFLPETNYSRPIYLHLRYRGIKRQWMKRLASL
uniref:Uncharacterized protein n=1 Tax=Rhipicephalus zambeziensis TaxID=60191 RepID=A0A224YR64_9ACAR